MIKAFATNVMLNGVASAIGSISIIFVVSMLSPSTWGVSAALLGVGQFAGAAISFGSQIERVKRYSRQEPTGARHSATQDSVARVTVGLVLATVALVAFLMGAVVVGSILIGAAGVFAGLGTSNFRVSQKEFGAVGVRIISEKLLALSIVGVSALLDVLDETTLPIAIGLAGLVVGLLDVLTLRPDRADIRAGLSTRVYARQWSNAFYYGLASMAPSLLLLDSMVVIAFSDSTQAGYLSLGSKLVSPLSIAATAIVTALLPYLSAGSGRVLPRIPKKKASIVLAAFGGMMAVFFILADSWVPWLFGSEYAPSAWPVRLYILNVVVILFTRVGVTILQAWDDQRVAGIMVSTQSSVALVGIAVGAYVGGALGASFALVLTNLVLAVLLHWRVRSLTAGTAS